MTHPVEDAPAQTPAAAWLDAEMDRVWLLAELCLRRMQEANLRPSQHPAHQDVEAIFSSRRAARTGKGDTPASLDELSQALAIRTKTLVDKRRRAPIARLASALALRPLELEALIVIMAPHVDQPLGLVFSLIRGEASRRGVDLALIGLLYRLTREQRVALLDVVDPERPLLSWRLLQVGPTESTEGYASVTNRALQPTLDLLSVVCGRGQLSPALLRTAHLRSAPANLDGLFLDEEVRVTLVRLCGEAAASREQAAAEVPWLVLWGHNGVGKREVAARWAACAGRPLLAFDLQASGKGDDLLRRAQREALLHGAVLYVGPLQPDALTTAQGAPELVRQLADFPGIMALGTEGTQPPRLKLERPVQEVALGLPSEPARLMLWERCLPAEAWGDDLDLPGLARAYHLTPGEIIAIAAEARAIARPRPYSVVRQEDLRCGIDRRLRNGLGEIARRLHVTATFDDLVLPDDDLERVYEFIGRSVHAEQVYREWGLGDRIGGGKGRIALFSGPPGTGKTMLAGLIARALRLSVYQIDLSQVISKWVGETEKQLARAFDQAERAHAVLLFDEADALLARRTEVKTSNDRYGNLAVNYLLQRLEQYTGVAILTTNKEAALDEALKRRLSLHLRLEVPEPPERERLWRSMLLPGMPCADDIDFRELARRYEMTGGYIKNATVRAAFLAAGQRMEIDNRLLHRAAVLELEDMGRLVTRTSAWLPGRDAA